MSAPSAAFMASGADSGEKGSWRGDKAGEGERFNDEGQEEIGSKPQGKKRPRGQRTGQTSSPANSRQQNDAAPLAKASSAELQEALARSQERAQQLERMLAERAREVAKLQVQRTQDMPANSEPMADRELKQLYCNSVQALKDYIAQTNLLSHDITGKHLPEHIILDLKTLIHRISKACLQAIKPETPMILELISKDYSMTTVASWELDKSRWINVIADLQLTEQQVLMVMKSREQHIAAMLSLFQERAVLCRQAADLAVKAASTNKFGNAGGPSGSMPGANEDGSMLWVLMKYGYMYCAHNMVALHRILELLKETLLKEQRAIMELFLKVVYQILSPVQAAIFVINSFPYHCDVLALANVLSSMFGKDGASGGAPSGSAAPTGAGLAGAAGGGSMPFVGGATRPSMEQGMGMQGLGLGSRGSLKTGGLGGGGLQGGGLGMGPGGAGNLGPMGMMQGQSHVGSSAAGNGGGPAGDAEVMASWLQMQGGNHMEAADAPASSASAPRPGAGADGAAPSAEGLSRLKKFLDSAGAANHHTSPGMPGAEGVMQGNLQGGVGQMQGGVVGSLAGMMDGGGGGGGPGGMFGSDGAGLGSLGGGGGMGGNQGWNSLSMQGGDMGGAGPSGHMGGLGHGGQLQQWQQLQLQQQQQQLQMQQQQQQMQQLQQAKSMGLSFGNGTGGLGGGLQGLQSGGNLSNMLGGGGMGGGGMSGNGMGQMGGMGLGGPGGMGRGLLGSGGGGPGGPGGLGGDMGGLKGAAGNSNGSLASMLMQRTGAMTGLDLSGAGGKLPPGVY